MNDAVFVGRVISGKRELVQPDQWGRDELGTWECDVVEAFKGVTTKRITIYTLGETVDSGRCFSERPSFEVAKSYLFYGSLKDGKLFTHINCSRTKAIVPFHEKPAYQYDIRDRDWRDNIADDFAFLRNLDPQRRGSIQGFVFSDVSEKVPEQQEIKVQLRGENFTAEQIPADRGYFNFQNLLPGNYKIEIIRPNGYKLGEYTPDNSRTQFTIKDCLCELETYKLTPVGQITGTLTHPDGSPLSNLTVYLQPTNLNGVKNHGAVYGGETVTDKNGVYTFQDVHVGNYLLGISLKGPSADSPFRKTFYPNTSQVSHAKVLALKRGQILSGYNFQLKQDYETTTVSGTVFWADGTPVKEAVVRLNRSVHYLIDYNPDHSWAKTDAQGNFVIKGIKDHRYKLVAEWHHENEVGTVYDFGYARSLETDIALNENQQGLRLVFPNYPPKSPSVKVDSSIKITSPPINRWQKYKRVSVGVLALLLLVVIWGSVKLKKRNHL